MGCVQGSFTEGIYYSSPDVVVQQDVDSDVCVRCILSKFPIKTFKEIVFKQKYNEECQIVCVTGQILPIPSQKSYFTPVLERCAVYAKSSVFLQTSSPGAAEAAEADNLFLGTTDSPSNKLKSPPQIFPEMSLFNWELEHEEVHEGDFFLVDPAFPSLKIRIKGNKNWKVKPQELCFNLPQTLPSSSSPSKSLFSKRSTSTNSTSASSLSTPVTSQESTECITTFDGLTISSHNANDSFSSIPGKSFDANLPPRNELTHTQIQFLQKHRISSQIMKHKPIKLMEASLAVGQHVCVLGVLTRVAEGKRAHYVLEAIHPTSITERYMSRKRWKPFQREIFMEYFKKHSGSMIVADNLFLNRKKPFPLSYSFSSSLRSLQTSSHDSDYATETSTRYSQHPPHQSPPQPQASQHLEIEDLEDSDAIGYRHEDHNNQDIKRN